ncbi:MAG: hypothetical protein R3264_11835 [Anaerolineae bacterium]|nr:hypothetical protein [Anaerolineae bacterium]
MADQAGPVGGRTWGIVVLALWAVVLVLVIITSLLQVTVSAELYRSPALVWLVYVIFSAFALAFGFSAFGLWQRYNWGRVLFLGAIGVWSVLNLIFLFRPDLLVETAPPHSTRNIIFSVARHLVGFILPLWYLNLAHIKSMFR